MRNTFKPGFQRTRIAIAAALMASGAFSDALAQPGPAPQNEQSGDGLQTVVVTAQKRVQPMQKVPVAVNVVNEKTIENQRIVEFSDLARVSPSLTIDPANQTVALRGIGTYALSIGVEPTVSIIIDDVPVVQQQQAFSNLSDIERVEVLRGPQGTLFGKNSTAGLINIVTKESTPEFSGHAQITDTSDHQRRAELSLSGPVNDKVGYRVNLYKDKRDGYIKNLTTGNSLSDESSAGVRARLDVNAANDLKVKLIADYSTRNGKTQAATFYSVPDNAVLVDNWPVPSLIVGITPGVNNFTARQDIDGTESNKQASLSGTVNWKVNDHTFTSATSYQDWKHFFFTDLDGFDVDIAGLFTGGRLHGGLYQTGPFHAKQITQEFRIATNGDGPFNYLAGVYYSDSKTDRSFQRGPVLVKTQWNAGTGTRSLAAFAQADYNLTDTTRLSAGLRRSKEWIDVDFNDTLKTPVTYLGSTSGTATTGKLSLQHDLAKAVMVYASYATGYKGAGYDVSSGFNQARADHPVAPETSKSYELGLKSRFLDNHVQLNATLFRTDYNDFQAQSATTDLNTGLLEFQLSNVGKLRTSGLELELSAKPTRSLQFDAAATYTNAVIRAFPNANCYDGQTAAQGCISDGNVSVQNLAGATLSNAPKVKTNLAVTYDMPEFGSGYKTSVHVDYQYQSKVNFDLFQNPLTVQSGYGVVNGNVTLTDPLSKYKLVVFGNNLFDKHYASDIVDNAGIYDGVHVLSATLSRNSRRYVGVRLAYDF